MTTKSFLMLSVVSSFLLGCAHRGARIGQEKPLASVAPVVTPKPVERTSEGELDFPVIDAHAHFHSKENKSPQQPSKEMLAEYRNSGVVGAIIHLDKEENHKVKVNRKAGLKLAVCAGIVPGETVQKIEPGLKAGRYQCMKVYLGYVPKYPSDKFYQPFYKLAQKYDIPVVFHTGDTYDKMAKVKYADPLGVDEVAVTYPKVKFVIAHMGNPWFESAAEVVYKNDNVYVDTSALLLGDVSKEDPEKVEALVIRPMKWFYQYVENPKKILFGTDWPLMDVKPYIAVVKKAIPEEHWREVFYSNAVELFKLDAREPQRISKND